VFRLSLQLIQVSGLANIFVLDVGIIAHQRRNINIKHLLYRNKMAKTKIGDDNKKFNK